MKDKIPSFEPSLRDRKGRKLSLDETLDGTRVEIPRRDFVSDFVWAGITLFGGSQAYAMNSAINERKGYERIHDELNQELYNLNTSIGNKRKAREEAERIEREKREEDEAERKVLEELKKYELNNPGNIPIEKSSDRLLLAKTIFAEAEAEFEHPEYMAYVGTTPLVRANLKGRSLLDIVKEKYKGKTGVISYAYSFLMPGNARNDDFLDPLKKTKGYKLRVAAWNKAYDIADMLTSLSLDEINPHLTHFYVNTVSEPKWANGITPVKKISWKGKTTRFYYIPEHFKKKAYS